MSHPVGGSGGGSGHDNDPAFSDKTRIVTRSDEDDDAGLATGPGADGPHGTAKIPGSGGAGAGKVVGVAGSGQGVRLPGFGGGAQAAPGGAAGGGGASPPGSASPPGGGGGKRPSGGQVTQLVLHGSAENKTEQDDPVVGWLVVMKGPGRGKFRPIFYGQNSIVRATVQRISIDFGDGGISREDHAYVAYDEMQRKFFIRDNGKANLVRCNGAPVMMPTEIKTGDLISIGATTLRFVPFCGPEFDWLDEKEKDAT